MKFLLTVCLQITLFSTVLLAESAADGNWPQWRGPAATGASSSATPPSVWSETNHIKWKVRLPGSGASTPIIWENLVFVQSAISTGKNVESTARTNQNPTADNPAPPAGRGGMRSEKPSEIYQFTLMALDRETGKTLWTKIAREELPHEGHHRDHGFSSYSPVTDGTLVFAYFGSRGLHCFDLKGNPKWSKDLGRMQTKNSFGEGNSPALSGNTIVINWDHEGDDFIAAFDKETGKELWRQPRDEDTTWATPLIIEGGGKKQVVTVATKKVRSYDLASGRQIWEAPGLTANVIPSPVGADGMVYVMSGFRGAALMAIRLDGTGDLAGTESIIWKHNKGTPYVPSPLLYHDKLYFFSGNNAVLSCFDVKAGKPLFDSKRIEAMQNIYASPVAAAGRVYLVGRDGTTVVLKDTPELEILAVNRLDEKFDASPALAGKALFLRGHDHLYCVAEK